MSADVSAGSSATARVLDTEVVAEVARRLDQDPIVAANTKWHLARIVLTDPGGSYPVDVERGSVRYGQTTQISAAQVHLRGEAESWTAILGGLHGGLHRAWRYGLLEFAGDPFTTFTLWKTIWRLGVALAEVGRDSHAIRDH